MMIKKIFGGRRGILLVGLMLFLVACIGVLLTGRSTFGLAGIALVGAMSALLALEFRRRFAVLAKNVRSVMRDTREIRKRIQSDQGGRGAAAGGAAGSDSTKPVGDVDALMESGAFDAEYYAVQAGREFSNDRSAAEHFVRHGMRAGLSFHPLIELSYLPSGIRGAYRDGQVSAVLKHLTGANSRTHLWSPVFDPELLDPDQQGGSLLLDKFGPGYDRDVPVPSNVAHGPAGWTALRGAVLDYARTITEIETARTEYRFEQWDGDAERSWLSEHDAPDFLESDTDPLVSIVMPVWNRVEMVGRAIRSVQSQTFSAWELIVVDDGSTDGTPEVVERIAETDRRVRLIRRRHGGVSAARNGGIEAAGGHYLAFLDSDNTWRQNFLGLMVAGLRRSGARAGYSGTHLHGDVKDEYTGQPISMLQMLIRNYVDLNVLVVEAELVREVGGFDENLRRWVDYDLSLKILERSPIEYFPFIGCDYVDDGDSDRITRRESANWVHAASERALVRWAAPRTGPADLPSSCVVLAGPRMFDTLATVRSLIGENLVRPEAVVVVDDMQHVRASLKLRAALAAIGPIRVVKLPRACTPAVGLAVARRHIGASAAVVLRAGIELRRGSVDALVEKVSEEGVGAAQPVVTDKTGVVLSAGIADREDRGGFIELARGLATDDVRPLALRNVDALSPDVFAVSLDAYDAVADGLAIYSGVGAFIALHRALRARGEQLEVCTEAVGVDRHGEVGTPSVSVDKSDAEWLRKTSLTSGVDVDAALHRIRLQVAGLTSGPRGVLDGPEVVYSRTGGSGLPGGLRWAIKIGAKFTPGGDKWGDVPFAANLVSALRGHGHHAVVDRVDAFARRTSYLDDVVLVVRGAEPCAPQPGKINMIWVISRPDRVTREELEAFDVVFVASRAWCEHVRRHWGIDAVFLPQATSPEHFHPRKAAERVGEIDVLFVGGPRPPIGRQIVADCVTLGYDVKVIGPGWGRYVPQHMVLADTVPNSAVAAYYASSRIVLNDHWADMARLGFVNNRLYDIVASGARAISDEVDSIDKIFGGAVQTYQTLDRLDELLRKDDQFPSPGALREIGERVRLDHSFEARARTLIARAQECLSE